VASPARSSPLPSPAFETRGIRPRGSGSPLHSGKTRLGSKRQAGEASSVVDGGASRNNGDGARPSRAEDRGSSLLADGNGKDGPAAALVAVVARADAGEESFVFVFGFVVVARFFPTDGFDRSARLPIGRGASRRLAVQQRSYVLSASPG
jgi:hypothetical protein